MYTEAKSVNIQNGGRDWSVMPKCLRNGGNVRKNIHKKFRWSRVSH